MDNQQIGVLILLTMDTVAKDLADLVRVECWPWPKVVIGHSMGGNMALQFTQSCG